MRKTFITAALFSILGATPIHAAFNYFPPDPQGTAMSGAMVAITNNPFGVFYNPASARKTMAGIAYTIPYGDSALGNFSAAANISLFPFDPLGDMSVGINRYDNDNYKEKSIVFGYARTIIPGLHTGISMTHMKLETDGNDEDTAIGFNAGLQAGLSSVLTFGISATNINTPDIGAPNIGNTNIKLETTTLTGLALKLPTGALLTVNTLSEPDRSTRLLAAGDFPVQPSLRVMVGVGTNPSLFSAGVTMDFDMVKATAAFSHDTDLGTTSSVGLSMSL